MSAANLQLRDAIAWNQVNGGGAWALNCAWKDANIGTAQMSGDQCGGKCASTSGCTHFAWDNVNGGTCYLKSGVVSASIAVAQTANQAMCGYLKQTAAAAPAAGTTSIKWKDESSGIYWARKCDWTGAVLSSTKGKGSLCGTTCAKTSGCTHFAWTESNGGTCWMKTGAVSKSDAIASSNKGEEYFKHYSPLTHLTNLSLFLGALCGGITAANTKPTKPTTAANPAKPTTPVTPTVPQQPPAPGKTVTSAYGAPPAYATKFPIIECDKTNTCYKRNTFLIPAWGGISSNIQETGEMSFGLGRFYLVDAAATTYKQFYLNNRQISFTTDLSGIKCGQNSALYFSAMPAALGSTYCDGQNTCMEMDILEGNIAASQVTTHECANLGQVNGNNCNHNGCAASGSTKFSTQVGPNSAVINTLKPFKVTTKFITSDNTDQGTLTNIVQVFEQEGRKFETGNINKGNCVNDYGNVAQMGRGQQAGMTLILSYWEGGMDWLDGGSSNPKCKSAGNQPAKYSNIRVEPIA
ncbi:hypothetical protein HDU81_004958 [Chytriomyces hyalinus]|nr:hypothetical protein HDU81_004958 [Chytriomyces hyalinus]